MRSSLHSLLAIVLFGCLGAGTQDPQGGSVFAKDNLVAWCIVPFDAAKRGPAERAKMLKRLGLAKVAYDWRKEHVPTFEQEILEYKKHGLEFFAFWGAHEKMFRLFKKHGIAPQVWSMMSNPRGGSQKEKVAAAGKGLLPLVQRTKKLGCKLALYNHGGWNGEPENLVAVCKWLRKNADADHVGIVYNFHHGHGHIGRFAEALDLMKPYLHCLNLNGMNPDAQPKILAIGKGRHERDMMEIIRKSGYRGPIGILDHRGEVDGEKSLRENLEGMKKVLGELGDKPALETYP